MPRDPSSDHLRPRGSVRGRPGRLDLVRGRHRPGLEITAGVTPAAGGQGAGPLGSAVSRSRRSAQVSSPRLLQGTSPPTLTRMAPVCVPPLEGGCSRSRLTPGRGPGRTSDQANRRPLPPRSTPTPPRNTRWPASTSPVPGNPRPRGPYAFRGHRAGCGLLRQDSSASFCGLGIDGPVRQPPARVGRRFPRARLSESDLGRRGGRLTRRPLGRPRRGAQALSLRDEHRHRSSIDAIVRRTRAASPAPDPRSSFS